MMEHNGEASSAPARSEKAAQPAAEVAVRKIEYGTPAFTRTIWALFAAGFATFALLYCVQPLLPVFSQYFHVSATGASLSLSLTTGLLAVSMLVAGVLSEAWGRKPIMVASLFLSAVLAMVSAVLPHWAGLLAARAAMGIALSGLPAVAMAYVGEEMHPKTLGLAMGLYIGGTGLGGMAGRLLTGVITDFLGWHAAVLAMGALGVLCAFILWRCLPESRNFTARPLRFSPLTRVYAAHLKDGVLPLLFVEGFLLMGGFVTVYNYVGYRLIAPPFSLSQAEMGLLFSVYLLGVVSSAWAGSLSGWLGRRNLLPITLSLMFVGAALTLAHSLWIIIAGVAVLTIGFFGSHSVVSAWVGARAKSGKAQASSLYLFAYYLGSSVVGSLGGVFWSRAGWTGVVEMTGVLFIVAVAVSLYLKQHSMPDAGRQLADGVSVG